MNNLKPPEEETISENLQKLLESWKLETTDLSNQELLEFFAPIFALLYNNIGAESEKLDKDPQLKDDRVIERFGKIDDAWKNLNNLLEDFIETNPKKAFEFARVLTLLPQNPDGSKEWRFRYLRGVGLYMLGNTKLTPLIQTYFLKADSGSSTELSNVIKSYINYSIENIKDEGEAFSTPEFYSVVAALRLGLTFEDSPSALGMQLLNNTMERIDIVEVLNHIKWYLQIDDTKAMAQEIIDRANLIEF